MYKLKNTGMKVLKIAHLFGVCCWFGGAISMLLLNLYSWKAISTGMLYGINTSSHIVDMWVVVAFGVYVCLITGFLYGIITSWGFFRQKWIVWKWIITIFCFLSGWFFLGNYVNNMLQLSNEFGNAALEMPDYIITKNKHLYLSIFQIFLLFFMISISVIKPWKKNKGHD